MGVLDIMRCADRLGIDYDINKPLVLSESEQIHNYIRSNPRFNIRNEVPISYDDRSNKTDARVYVENCIKYRVFAQ